MSAISMNPITASSFNFSESRKIHEKPIKFSAQRFDFRRDLIRGEPISRICKWKTQNFMKGFAEVRASRSDEGVEVFEQDDFSDGSLKFGAGGLEATLNTMSKWVVAATLAAVMVWRHDAKVLWAAIGAIVNTSLSLSLKKILNQERPNSTLRSDPGMPSSHAQSISYTFSFLIISIIEYYGINTLTATLSGFFIIIGTYFAWLRVSQQLHTVIQVVVGAVVGSTFSVFWFWAWNAFVLNFFKSSLLVRFFVISGAVGFYVSLGLHVIRAWIGDESDSEWFFVVIATYFVSALAARLILIRVFMCFFVRYISMFVYIDPSLMQSWLRV